MPPPPGGEHLVVDLNFLSVAPFSSGMWAIKLQSAQLRVATLYVIEVQNGHLDFIPRFSVFVWKKELYVSVLCSFKKWATTNLLPNKLRRFVNSCEWRMSLAGFSQGWGQKIGSLLLLSLATDPSMVRKRCWLLEGKVTQPIEQQAENRSDNCILDTNYLFAGVAFVTRNSNQTTRRSPPGGVDGWAWDYWNPEKPAQTHEKPAETTSGATM